MSKLTCFKAYDIRGKLVTELNEDIAYRIGRAFAIHTQAKKIVVGGDARETSESLKLALAKGLMAEGCDVHDIGMVGTEEIYFATSDMSMDGGIIVTASHNPIDYNGMKLVREQSKPISGDTGLFAIQQLAEQQPWLENDPEVLRCEDKVTIRKPANEKVCKANENEIGAYIQVSNLGSYVDHLLTYIKPANIKPLKLVVNSGNGAAGHVIDELENRFRQLNLSITFIKVHHQPDGAFPNGIPNPLLPENRVTTAEAVVQHGADMGIAWDGDFDRCFLFDENGSFIEGYYIVGLLAEAFLAKNKGAKIIHDPRLTWNTIEQVESAGGLPVMSKTGHASIKERMREEDAIYGGEMSAHHYFRDFAYCDSGMIPWLLVAELVCLKEQSLSSLVQERIAKFPSSGEINSTLGDPEAAISKVMAVYEADALVVDRTDGISLEFADWRFNLRMSNTEPVVRLNVESRANISLMQAKTAEILKILGTE